LKYISIFDRREPIGEGMNLSTFRNIDEGEMAELSFLGRCVGQYPEPGLIFLHFEASSENGNLMSILAFKFCYVRAAEQRMDSITLR
jgi:hypothetical protein